MMQNLQISKTKSDTKLPRWLEFYAVYSEMVQGLIGA